MYIYIYVYFFSKNYYRLLFRDHSGGNEEIVRSVDGLTVYGGDSRIPALTKKVVHDDTFKVIIYCGDSYEIVDVKAVRYR